MTYRRHTLDSLKELSSKYSKRKDFKQGDSAAYETCRVNGWLDEVCSHMPKPNKKKWTRADALAAAALVTKVGDIPGGAVSHARKNGYYDELVSHFEKPVRWDRKSAKAEALKHHNRRLFWDTASGAARFAKAQGETFYEECCAHMPEKRMILSDEEVIERGLKYETNAAFEEADPAAASAARHRGFYTKLTDMRPPKHVPTVEECYDKARTYTSRTAFRQECATEARVLIGAGKYEDAVSHIPKYNVRWTEEAVREEASKYTTRSQLYKSNRPVHQAAERLGILDELLPVSEKYLTRTVWTHDGVKGVAKACKHISQFRREHEGAFEYAKRNGILDEVFPPHKKKRKLTVEMVRGIAARYKTRKAFKTGDPGAYKATVRWRMLDDICAHMPKYVGIESDSPTYLYRYVHPEGYVYIGLTTDPDSRHKQHADESHNELAMFCANDHKPEYFERYVDYKDTFEPYVMERETAERFERIQIRKYSSEGWKVVNKHHNPQYQNGRFSWEDDPLPVDNP